MTPAPDGIVSAALRPGLVGLLLLFGLAAAPATLAAGSARLDADDARHLLSRTGFGPTSAEVVSYTGLTRAEAATLLLATARRTAVTEPPPSATDAAPLRPPRGDEAPLAERQAFVRRQAQEALELRAWWVRELIVTPSPLTERMTLLWHNHFVSAQPKVRVTRLMYRQNVTLREHALGSFAALLRAIARDPAMVIYLDGTQNRRGAPNENFAREVMELFTLGEGHYGEQDVKEAARAFTGTSLVRETGQFVFRPGLHDGGSKTVLGTTGRLDGDAVIDILLAQPQTAIHVTSRLWREFVSPDPDPAVVERLARRFRQSGYDIRGLLHDLLTEDAFYAPENRGVLVKSPVELVVGTLRQLEVTPSATLPLAVVAAGMGQNLFAPPNVKGWPGGEQWINSASLLARKQYLDRLLRVDEKTSTGMAAPGADDAAMRPADAAVVVEAAGERRARTAFERRMEGAAANLQFDSARWLAALPGATPAEHARSARRLLLPIDPPDSPPADAIPQAIVRALLQEPAYQLK